MWNLISFAEAVSRLEKNVDRIKSEEMVPVSDSVGRTLFRDIFADTDLPLFNQSNVDGYGFRFDDLKKEISAKNIKVVKAGDTRLKVQPGDAVRIFTGAMVPAEIDTIVMQEAVSVNGRINIHDHDLFQGKNIRKKGLEITKGEKIASRGQIVTPSLLGFLVQTGISKVPVTLRPNVALIVTGNEVTRPGKKLLPGRVPDSLSPILKLIIKQTGALVSPPVYVKDDPGILKTAILAAEASSDVLVITGGVSVGDYDFTSKTLREIGVQEVFHGVRQKPGKPVFFGKKGNTIFFGLPGNPGSALICACKYLIPAISHMHGHQGILKFKLVLGKAISKPLDFTHFRIGKMVGNQVFPVEKHDSFMLRGFSEADCIISLPEGKAECLEGDEVEIQMLPT